MSICSVLRHVLVRGTKGFPKKGRKRRRVKVMTVTAGRPNTVREIDRPCWMSRVFRCPTPESQRTWRSAISVASFITLIFAKRQCPFGENCLLYEDVLSHVNYNGHSSVITRHSLREIEMKGTPRMSGPVRIDVPVPDRNEKDRSQISCPEQRSVNWVEELVNKFSKSGELVATSFIATSVTAMKCLDLP